MLIQSIAILATLAASPSEPQVITLEQALEIALSENVSVKVADKEIQRAEYAKKGTYAALFPQIDGSASFQRTIEKQVMYMDFDMSSIMGPGAGGSEGEGGEESSKQNNGMEVGRWNSFSAGFSAGMPLVNFQVWESLRISGQDVELAVEKARSSRLEMVTQVKSAYYSALLAKESYKVYKEVYDSQNAITLTLWQLKAVMGVDLDMEIDVAGELADYARDMSILFSEDELTLDNNSTMRQLAIQAEQLASAVKSQQYAYLPSLNLSFVYNYSAMANDFEFSTYNWTPYSYVGLSLSIPIFSGGKRLNNVRAAKVQASELELQTENTRRQLQISIRQNINTMETAMHSYEAAGKALKSAEKAYDITQTSYEVGSSTLTDLNDAQLALVQARMSVSQSIFSYLNAKASLEQTLGCDFLE